MSLSLYMSDLAVVTTFRNIIYFSKLARDWDLTLILTPITFFPRYTSSTYVPLHRTDRKFFTFYGSRAIVALANLRHDEQIKAKI